MILYPLIACMFNELSERPEEKSAAETEKGSN
jgi:hypothetical protein